MIFADDVTKAQSEISEEELLSKGRWSQFLENEKFHSVEENTSARERCKQLLVGGVAAVDWIELCGQK